MKCLRCYRRSFDLGSRPERLTELHIDYEKQPKYKLEQIEDDKAEVTFRVERMKLSKDKTSLRYNDFLTLRGIPPATFDYRLGNRSARWNR